MKTVNSVTLLGHIGTIESKPIGDNGNFVTNFSIATNSRWTEKDGTKKEVTEWHRCEAWAKTGELMAEMLGVGSKVYVMGHLKTQKWTDDKNVERYSTKIIVDDFSALDGKADEAE